MHEILMHEIIALVVAATLVGTVTALLLFGGPNRRRLVIRALVQVGVGVGILLLILFLLSTLKPFALVLIWFGIISAATGFVRVRRTRALRTLTYVEQAVALNLPLPAMLEAAAKGESAPIRDRLLNIKRRLEYGLSPATAVGESIPELPGRWWQLLLSAEAVGRFAPALSHLVRRESDDRLAENRCALGPWRTYPALLLIMVALIIQLQGIFVLPMFRKIVQDFTGDSKGAPSSVQALPQVRQMLSDSTLHPATGPVSPVVESTGPWSMTTFHATSETAGYGYAMQRAWMYESAMSTIEWFSGGGTALFLLIGGVGLTLLLTLSRVARRVVVEVAWHLPIIGRHLRDRAMAESCMILGETVSAGFTLERAVRQAGTLRISAPARRMFNRWAKGMESGSTPVHAAHAAGIPALVTGTIGSLRHPEHAAEIFEFLHQHYQGRLITHRRRTIALLTTLAMVIVLAGVLLMNLTTVGFMETIIWQTMAQSGSF